MKVYTWETFLGSFHGVPQSVPQSVPQQIFYGALLWKKVPPEAFTSFIIEGSVIGSMAKWLCSPLGEATSAALPYTRRAGFWACTESTRPVQPRSTQP